jgi:hypothetical protein
MKLENLRNQSGFKPPDRWLVLTEEKRTKGGFFGIPEGSIKKDEGFLKNGILYMDEMPLPPKDKLKKTVLPLSDPQARKIMESSNKSLKWTHTDTSISNQQFGSVEQAIFIRTNNEGKKEIVHDSYLVYDGPIDKNGLSTGGAVTAPVEKVKMSDGSYKYYVHFTFEYRVAAFDHKKNPLPDGLSEEQRNKYIAENRGEWFPTVSGGFANSTKESPTETGKREAREETPYLKISNPKYTTQFTNRAVSVNPIYVGYATYEANPNYKDGETIGDGNEVFSGKYAVPLDVFETQDGLVTQAVNFARQNLGLISASA